MRYPAVIAVAAIFASTALGAVPSKLLGKYSRTISAKTLAGTGLPGAAGVWSVTFQKDGTAFVQGPAAFSAYQHFSATADGHLTFRDQFCSPAKGAYRWSVSGKTLTIKNVGDRCVDRSAVLTGAWKRK